MMKNRVFFSFVAISYVLCNSVFADDVKLDDVEVTQSFDDGYRAVSSDISKTRTPILEIPQTINVITNQQIKDKKPESLAESLANVSGVSYANSVVEFLTQFLNVVLAEIEMAQLCETAYPQEFCITLTQQHKA